MAIAKTEQKKSWVATCNWVVGFKKWMETRKNNFYSRTAYFAIVPRIVYNRRGRLTLRCLCFLEAHHGRRGGCMVRFVLNGTQGRESESWIEGSTH